MNLSEQMTLEERTCACGCKKKFRCLTTSSTRYSSLHCMEMAGVLPPPIDKRGYNPSSKGMRPEVPADGEEQEDSSASENSEIPLLLDDEEINEDHRNMENMIKNPAELMTET